MLKVLLYGLATFMETGIGVWIFSQTFSERRILEKKYYVLEWLLYSLIFFVKKKGDGLKKNIIYRHDILVNRSVLGWISIVVNDYSWEWNNCIICFLLL